MKANSIGFAWEYSDTVLNSCVNMCFFLASLFGSYAPVAFGWTGQKQKCAFIQLSRPSEMVGVGLLSGRYVNSYLTISYKDKLQKIKGGHLMPVRGNYRDVMPS